MERGLRRCQLAKAAAGHRVQERLARRALVVPGERNLTHEARVRCFEALVSFEHLRQPHDTPLAADAADLNRLVPAHERQATERATRSAQTACNPSARPTSS